MRRVAIVLGVLTLVFSLLLGALALYDRAAPAAASWLGREGLEARFAIVGGHRLRYLRSGSGPAVVLVHGFGSSLDTWKDVIPALAVDHEVVALDLPGFGLSDDPADLTIGDLPRAVVGLMDRLRIPCAALVGNSMGGAAVALVAAERPERVSALVLIDAAGFDLGPSGQPRLVRIMMSPLGELMARLPGKRLLVELALRQVFYDERLVTAERVAEYLRDAKRPAGYLSVRSLGESLRGQERIVEDALAKVRAPTLVVWGRHDAWIPLATAARFTSAIAGSRQVLIADSGHLPQEERPQELLGELTRFLANVSPPGCPASRGPSALPGSAGTR